MQLLKQVGGPVSGWINSVANTSLESDPPQTSLPTATVQSESLVSDQGDEPPLSE